MNEALILEKLDKLTDEVKSLKSDVLQELKQELEIVPQQTQPEVTGILSEIEGGQTKEVRTGPLKLKPQRARIQRPDRRRHQC